MRAKGICLPIERTLSRSSILPQAVAPRHRELTTNTPKMGSLAIHKNMLKLKRNRKNHHNYCRLQSD
jgi:hypothetical protein